MAAHYQLDTLALVTIMHQHGIRSYAELARRLGMSRPTTWRIGTGAGPVTAEFMAGCAAAFPQYQQSYLFKLCTDGKPTA